VGIYGVPVATLYGHGGGETPVEGQYGEANPRTSAYSYGVPAPWSGAPGPDDQVAQDEHTSCSETTKKGAPCKAPRAKGTDLCIGHLRSRHSAVSGVASLEASTKES